MTSKLTRIALALFAVAMLVGAAPDDVRAAEADYHHVHITSSAPTESVRWYERYLDCEPIADRDGTADCHGVEVTFVVQPTMGSTQGTGVNHIGFSYPDLTAKMGELEAVGVRGSGVRLQRFEGGATLRDVPGLFKIGFIFDPWGTRIELVEDTEYLGFHHIHLSATDPEATLAWYEEMFGGERDSLKGRLDGLRYGDVWLFASEHGEGIPATTEGRAIDHIGFVVDDLDVSAPILREAGAEFLEEPVVPEHARTAARRAFIAGPDNVRLAVVETGFAGVDAESLAPVFADVTEPYDTPRAPLGRAGPAGCMDRECVARDPPGAVPRPRGDRGVDVRGGGIAPGAGDARQHLGLRAGVARHDARLRQERPVDPGGNGHRPARRPFAGADGRGRAPGRRGGAGARPLRRDQRGRSGTAHAVCALHLARAAGADDALDLQQRPADLPGPGLRRDPEGDDPRDPRHPHRAA